MLRFGRIQLYTLLNRGFNLPRNWSSLKQRMWLHLWKMYQVHLRSRAMWRTNDLSLTSGFSNIFSSCLVSYRPPFESSRVLDCRRYSYRNERSLRIHDLHIASVTGAMTAYLAQPKIIKAFPDVYPKAHVCLSRLTSKTVWKKADREGEFVSRSIREAVVASRKLLFLQSLVATASWYQALARLLF